ncbi:MAG TPA: hypothetical protein VMU30_07735 [Bacteroidota bacterium]|nr:hypothetical protein [Bacteroidota bacterium]
MAHKIISFVFLIAAIGFAGCASEQYAQHSRYHGLQQDTVQKMTKEDVIHLSKNGVSDSLIIGMMDATDTWFQLKPQDIIDLKNAGVSENVIHAMMQQPTQASSQSENSKAVKYYLSPPYYWYDGFYPYWYWYYPSVSVRIGGFHGFRHGRFH